MNNGLCETCKFFAPPEPGGQPGTCHRHPPQVPGDGNWGEWPEVRSDDWCGDYKESGT